MNKISKILLTVAITITIIAFLFTVVFPIGTDFHIENRSVQDEKYYVTIMDVSDCDVSISYNNNQNFFYAFDVHLSSLAIGPSAYSVLESDSTRQIIFTGSDLVESVDCVLGVGMTYDITVEGRNLDTEITFSNGAIADDVNIYVRHNGSLEFILEESVSARGDLDLEIGIGNSNTPSEVRLNIDLPNTMNGVMNFDDDSNVTIHESIGWYLQRPPFDRIEYSTSSTETPLLDIHANQMVSSVVAWLSN